MKSHRMLLSRKNLFALLLSISLLLPLTLAQAASEVEPIEFWDSSNEKKSDVIDHSVWQSFLDQYLVTDHSSGINRLDYKAVSIADKKRLNGYLEKIQKLDPRSYSKSTQKAYWINIYNALTVKLILDNYPISSITEIGEGLFSFGPWDDVVANIQGQTLTLNQIEHGILRPIWQDNRVHYAVNCASLSCPNLSAQVFTASNTEMLLELSAKAYINHPRAVRFEDGELIVSSIYHWYKDDFGDQDALLLHLQQYALAPLEQKLSQYQGGIDHDYDWELNGL